MLSRVDTANEITLTPELIFTFLMPPLVFEAALYLEWRMVGREGPLVLSLAFVAMLLSALVVVTGPRSGRFL